MNNTNVTLILDEKQADLIINALDTYIYIASNFVSYDEYTEINILKNHIYAQFPKELYE